MADNVAITQGAGTTVAADDISSVFYQRVKLSLGADGTAVDAVAGAGAVGTGVQRVTLANDDPAVAALALVATAANQIPNTTAASGIASVVSTALETGHVIKNSAGNLYRLTGAATTVAGYFLVHNTTAVPAAGAVTPVKAYPVGIGQAIDISFDPPLRCGTGISVSFTSAATPFTQTDSATAFISGDAV